jgi:hypothetical protein
LTLHHWRRSTRNPGPDARRAIIAGLSVGDISYSSQGETGELIGLAVQFSVFQGRP